jgi:acyl-ACP thioesterase
MAMQYAQGKCYPTQLLSILASIKHFSTILTHFLNKSILRSANLAWVIVEKKSIPLYKESTSMEVSIAEETILFAFSQAVLILRALEFTIMSTLSRP